MTHMVCGYPNLEESQKIFDILKQKSEYLEIQFPFSDPIADWSVIEKANEVALKNWMTTEKCFDFVEKNIKNDAKILIMTYYNIVLNYSVEKFVKKAKKIWVFGFIIPDVPFDEEDWKNFRELCKKYDIVFTEIVSPITTKKRLEEIKDLKPKLIYAISQNMTTWSKAKFWKDFEKYIKSLSLEFSLPYRDKWRKEHSDYSEVGVEQKEATKIWVWFWVKTREDVEQINNISDFAIIWSEFIKKYNSWGESELQKYLEEISW